MRAQLGLVCLSCVVAATGHAASTEESSAEPTAVVLAQDVLVSNTAWGGPCEESNYLEEYNSGCSSVHAVNLEKVANNNASHGDIYVVAFWDAQHRVRWMSYDTTRGKLPESYWATPVNASINRAGWTPSCTFGGTTYTDGCGWIAGYQKGSGDPYIYLLRAASRGGTNGVAYHYWYNIAAGWSPAGDSGRICVRYNPWGACLQWDWKVFVAYINPLRYELRGLFVALNGTVLSDFLIASTGVGRKPQVSWDHTSKKWIIAYSTHDVWYGTKYVGYIRTATVDWWGNVMTMNAVDYCEPAGDCGPSAMVGGDAGPLSNDPCQCRAMWVVAAKAGDPEQFLLHQNYYREYLLNASGAAFPTWVQPGGAGNRVYLPIDLTNLAGYQFQAIMRNVSDYSRPHIYRFPPDTIPAGDPWSDGRSAPTDGGAISVYTSALPVALRVGVVSAAAVVANGSYLYLSTVNN